MTTDSFPANQNFGGPPTISAGDPTPVNTFVIAQPPPLARSLVAGLQAPVPNVNVAAQDLKDIAGKNIADWLVTGDGNFKTNDANGTQFPFKILSVVVTDSGLPTQAYQVFLQSPVNLFGFGLDLTDLLVSFPSAAPVSGPENVPQRPIVSFNGNWFRVNAFDQFGNLLTIPGFNQTIQIGVVRSGPDVTSQSNLSVVNVIVAAPQQPPPPVLGVVQKFDGNFQATSGVVRPFIGSGTPLPPLSATTEVENQTFGQGLPLVVYVP